MEEIKLRLWICLTNGFIMSFIHLSQIGWGDATAGWDPSVHAFNNSQSSLIGGGTARRGIVTDGRARARADQLTE